MKKCNFLLLIIILISSCTDNKLLKKAQENQLALKALANSINNDFLKIKNEVGELSQKIQILYENQDSILPTIDKSKYSFAVNGVFYKPVNDGNSALFVSGAYPITDEVKNIVYFTEPIDDEFKVIKSKYNEIIQVYYNDKYAINRIYPYFDVLAQYEPKLDIPAYNFYYLADSKHNPDRKSVWVNEPYVDPAGRGWMVSAIAPVYYKNNLVGVPGIDVTINTITERYLLNNPNSMTMIIDNSGMIVAAQENTINLFSFPPLVDHKYIETIKQDTYRKEIYNLTFSKDETVRKIAKDIIVNKQKLIQTKINNEETIVIAEYLPELNWYILEIIK